MSVIIELQAADALLIVDVQMDFLPGGTLAVPRGNEVIAPLNQYIHVFMENNLPIYASRDWHPKTHCSFSDQNGIWPPHCIQNSYGAEFSKSLNLPIQTIIISKAMSPGQDAYSAFDGTQLNDLCRHSGTKRLFIGGLATEYCVLSTVEEALKYGFDVCVLSDAIRAINIEQHDGEKAIGKMKAAGAVIITLSDMVTLA